jgi:hypothetical protein
VWFADFVMAHKRLKIRKMVSIESDPIVASRAKFNRPYRFIAVEEGNSHDILPELLKRKGYRRSPWIVWLDYDGILSGDSLSDIYLILDEAPYDSALIVTFNVQSGRYGQTTSDRKESLEDLFGEMNEDLDDQLNQNASFARTIQRLLLDDMVGYTSRHGRDEVAIPAFDMRYKDSQWMATVGVLLPRASTSEVIGQLVAKPVWRGMPTEPINTPLLTSREVATLQSNLPHLRRLSRRRVRQLGFDLEQAKIDAYVQYYAEYPTFVQVGP